MFLCCFCIRVLCLLMNVGSKGPLSHIILYLRLSFPLVSWCLLCRTGISDIRHTRIYSYYVFLNLLPGRYVVTCLASSYSFMFCSWGVSVDTHASFKVSFAWDIVFCPFGLCFYWGGLFLVRGILLSLFFHKIHSTSYFIRKFCSYVFKLLIEKH